MFLLLPMLFLTCKFFFYPKADWTAKRLVWVPDAEEGFVRGSVQSDNGDSFRVSMEASRVTVKMLFLHGRQQQQEADIPPHHFSLDQTGFRKGA